MKKLFLLTCLTSLAFGTSYAAEKTQPAAKSADKATAQKSAKTADKAAAADQVTQEDIANVQWMNYYYFHKDDSRTGEFLKFVERLAGKNESIAKPSTAFLSILFAEKKDKVEGWLKDAKLTGKARDVVVSALWMSGNTDKIKMLSKEVPKWAAGTPPKLQELGVRNIGDLDMMWGSFFASGNETYLSRIIDTLDETKPLSGGNDEADKNTRIAAIGSLVNNGLQHEAIVRVIKREAGTRTGNVKDKLNSILADIGKNVKPLPNQDGEFSAMMVPTDMDSSKQLQAPPGSGITINEKKQVKPGEELALNIIFSGMAVDNDLKADVVYDIEVLDPEGKVYAGFSKKDLEALKLRVPSRFRLFNVPAFPVAKFADTDKLGKYKINLAVRDNVGGKKVAWTTEIELVK